MFRSLVIVILATLIFAGSAFAQGTFGLGLIVGEPTGVSAKWWLTGRTAVDAALWITILRSCAAYEPFVKRKENVLSGSAVAEFMIFDRSVPRSVLHNLDRVSDFLALLHAGNEPGYYSPSGEVLHRLRGSLLQMSIDDVRSKGLHETLTWIVEQVAVLCDAIHEEFLDPTNESVRSRLRRQAGTSWFQQQDSAAGRQQQAQTPSSEG